MKRYKYRLLLLTIVVLGMTAFLGCSNNDELSVQNNGESVTPILDSLMEPTTFSSDKLGISYVLPEKYFRSDNYGIVDTRCNLSISEGTFNPEEDRDNSMEVQKQYSNDYQVIDKGTVTIDNHEGFWVESRYTNEEGSIHEYSVYLPHPSAPSDQEWDFYITLTANDSEENTKDFERCVSGIPNMIKYTDENDNNASFISGVFVNNENLIMLGTDMHLHELFITSMSESLLSGRPMYVTTSVESVEVSDANNGSSTAGGAEEAFYYYKSIGQLTNPDLETGTTSIDDRECYWLKYNSEIDNDLVGQGVTYGHYYLFLPGKNAEPIKFSLIFKGDVNSEWSQEGINDITKTIDIGD